MEQHTSFTRRKFIGQSTAGAIAAALPWIIPSRVLGLDRAVAPSEKVSLGVIGFGPRATYDLTAMLALPDVQCVAVSDVQASRRDEGKSFVDKNYGNTECKVYRDLRELLDRKDIDAVLIATGDRWHAPASILAAEAGKDIYCEKPCGLTIADCQNIATTIKSTQRVFQAGTQRRSVPNFRQAVRLAESGKLGKLQTLYASVYRPELGNNWLPGEPTPPRDNIDWNLWLGPAPWRPYNSRYVRGSWRGYYDFESGARLLDWDAHTVDLCQWANSSDATTPIEYEPTAANITCRYANGVKLILDFLPTPFGDRGPNWITRLGTCPVRFVGEEGSVETGDSGESEVSSADLKRELVQSSKVSGLDVSAHARNFFDSVKTRAATIANADVMRRSHIVCHAAALAWIFNRKLMLDPMKEEFVNDDEANSLRSRASRNWHTY